MAKYKNDKEAFAAGLFSNSLDRYYIPEFVTHLGLRKTAYDIFRMVYFYTDQCLNGGYVSYTKMEIAIGLGVSLTTVNRAFLSLLNRGLIIREMVQRDGRVRPGYRVDKEDIWRRIEAVEKERCTAAIYKAPSERELAPKVTEGECGTGESAITTLAEAELSHSPSTTKGGPRLAAARSPHGSGTLSSIHSRSAASLPPREGGFKGR